MPYGFGGYGPGSNIAMSGSAWAGVMSGAVGELRLPSVSPQPPQGLLEL